MQVDPEYKENIESAVKAIEKFVSSGFKAKDFPMVSEDNDEELEPSLFHMITWFKKIDPSWFHDGSRIDAALDEIRDIPQKMGNYEDILGKLSEDDDDGEMEKIHQYIAYQMTQIIDSHKNDFHELLSGISNFSLFTTPSRYKKALSIFDAPMQLNDIRDILGDNNQFYIFNGEEYVKGIFQTDQIKLSSKFKQEKEIDRFKEYRDSGPTHIIFEPLDNDIIQEQAEINFFAMVNPNHIRYHQNRFQPSQQFISVIKKLIAGLKTCDTPEDVEKWLNDKTNRVNPDDYTSMVLPSILTRIFADEKKFQNRLFNEKNLKKYTDSYESIIGQDKNLSRFKDYDLFSTFKADKDGTIQFLEDFLSLKLVSDPNAYISNHILLVLFNIFDSRIYLDILYNVLPQSEKKGEYETEDGFVKAIRTRINENSNKSSPYDKKTTQLIQPTTTPTSSQVSEYALELIHSIGDTSTDIKYIYPIIQEACRLDIETLFDQAYNRGYSEWDVIQMIQESGYGFAGKVPAYMTTRIKNTGTPDVSVEPAPEEDLPPDLPTNDIGDLIDSIDTRVDAIQPDEQGNMDFADGFGNDAEVTPNTKGGHIVYNITYNYHNSNNTTTDSHNTVTKTIDQSINKTTGNSTSNNRYRKNAPSKPTKGSNNYNNDTFPTNPKDTTSKNASDKDTSFSTGKSVQEVFAMLRSEEPLFVREGAEKMAASLVNSAGVDLGLLPETNPKPKESLAVKAQDFDRKTLAKQQKALKGVQDAQITANALSQPSKRTQDWLRKQMDSITAKNEEQQQRDMLEDPNYRTLVRKVFRVAINCGLFAIAFSVAPSIGCLAAVQKGMDISNRSRMANEMQREFLTEIQIVDDKIARAKSKSRSDNAQTRAAAEKEMHELMRIRAKMMEKATRLTKYNIHKQGIITQKRDHSGYGYGGYDYY